MRRHHLIEESKAELDVAYEEVKRAEHKIMDLEREYNARAADGTNGSAQELAEEKSRRQEALNIETLYGMQNQAIERFSIVSAVFGIVTSVNDDRMSADLIRKLLFDNLTKGRQKIDSHAHVRNFSKSLGAYSREESSAENDHNVRDSWAKIEATLREQGHQF